MTPQDLTRLGELLFGNDWRRRLARALEVDRRTLYRWVDGEHPVPPGVWPDIATLCRQKGVVLTREAARLDKLAA